MHDNLNFCNKFTDQSTNGWMDGSLNHKQIEGGYRRVARYVNLGNYDFKNFTLKGCRIKRKCIWSEEDGDETTLREHEKYQLTI